ncbi:transposase [Streptomyces sp. NPDC057798]|uniref:transposase n=1 Tax=Streptomyces sp. NPDC057798 TaxID=3346252 RepID=UPI0036AEC52C
MAPGKATAAALGAWLVFEDEAAVSMTSHRSRTWAPAGITWQDYRDLLVRAHLQLGGPIVVIWDNLNVHRCSRLREYAAKHAWLTIVQLPSYAPDLNPGEGIWSLLRRDATANVVFRDRDHLVQAVRSDLRRIQLRTDLIEGCLTETGLSLNTTTQRKGQ